MSELTLLQRVAAYALVRDDDGRVLLARTTAAATTPETWFLPGGGVEHGEHPEEAVVREVAEETGYRCVPRELLQVRSSVADIGGGASRVHTIGLFYRAEIRGGELRNEIGGSTECAMWIGLDEALGLVLAPHVGDLLAAEARVAAVRG